MMVSNICYGCMCHACDHFLVVVVSYRPTVFRSPQIVVVRWTAVDSETAQARPLRGYPALGKQDPSGCYSRLPNNESSMVNMLMKSR